MYNIGPMFAASGKLGVGYAQKLLADVSDQDCSRFARIGDTIIESNHPAFIIGHLTLYPTRVVGQLGANIETVAPPESFEKLFSHEAKCIDDPNRSIYPPLREITSVMMAGYGTAIQLLESTEDEAFQADNPVERLRDRFPTLGSALGFYVGGHMMMHLGQFSAWRRAMGMGAA
jgi:hypothetical protein